MTEIEKALGKATDTKACVIGAGATESAAKMFRELFPEAKRAIVVSDPRTRKVAGARIVELLKAAGVEVAEHVICPDGSWFHATYDKVEEVRDAILACNRTFEQSNNSPGHQFLAHAARKADVREVCEGGGDHPGADGLRGDDFLRQRLRLPRTSAQYRVHERVLSPRMDRILRI